MLVTIEDLKHVLFPPLSRLIHINGENYTTFIMHSDVIEYEKKHGFNLENFIERVVLTEGAINGFYLIDHNTEFCYYVLTDGVWDITVEEFFFRTGIIEFREDKFTLPKEFYDMKDGE
jgi:hypothetical protein